MSLLHLADITEKGVTFQVFFFSLEFWWPNFTQFDQIRAWLFTRLSLYYLCICAWLLGSIVALFGYLSIYTLTDLILWRFILTHTSMLIPWLFVVTNSGCICCVSLADFVCFMCVFRMRLYWVEQLIIAVNE